MKRSAAARRNDATKAKAANGVAKRQPKSIPEPAIPPGVDTFDGEGSVLLVDAPLEATADAFAKLLGGGGPVTHKPDVLGKTLRAAAPSYLLFRLAGCPWTFVQDLRVARPDDAPSDAHARKLSAALKCRVIAFLMSDTAGVWGYWLYTAGALTELLDHNADGDTDPAERLGRDAKRLKLTAADVNVYASATRKLPAAKVARGPQLLDELMKAQDAPGFLLETGRAGDGITFDLDFPDLDEDAIERLDYLAPARQARTSRASK